MNQEILDFLLFAKQTTYAGHGAEVAPTRPSSHDLSCGQKDLFYYDTYIGTALFSGEEAVWQNNSPLWAMNYSGRVLDPDVFSGDVLKAALRQAPKDMPIRGPRRHMEGAYLYASDISGDMSWFQGYETIRFEDRIIYECYFHGGEVR